MSIQVATSVWRASLSKGSALLLLLAIADFAHDDGTGAYPSVPTLAKMTRLGERQVQYLLRQLEESGELRTIRRTRQSNLFQIVIEGAVECTVAPATKGAVDFTPMVQPSAPMGAVDSTPMVQPSAPEPLLEPSLEPSTNLTRASRAGGIEIPTRVATTKEIAREQRRFGKAAEEVWTVAARKAGSPYITRGHMRQVHELAIHATQWASEQQVLSAIRQRLDGKSAPVRIPEWARMHAADDEQVAQDRRRVADRERELLDTPDPRVTEHLRDAAAAMRMPRA